jgi:citrate lyase synthetase
LSWRGSKKRRADIRFPGARTVPQRNWQAVAALVPPGTLSFLMQLAESEHQTA